MSAIHPPDQLAVIDSLTTYCERGGQLLLKVPDLDVDDQTPDWWRGRSPDLYRWADFLWDFLNTAERRCLLRPHGNVVRVDNFAEVCCSVFDRLETHLHCLRLGAESAKERSEKRRRDPFENDVMDLFDKGIHSRREIAEALEMHTPDGFLNLKRVGRIINTATRRRKRASKGGRTNRTK